MGKTAPGKDGARAWPGHAFHKGMGHPGPAALLEAAAISDGCVAMPKRGRPKVAIDGQANAGVKRRRVDKSEAMAQAAHDNDDSPTPKSRFLGVHWNKCKKKWRVRIKIAGRDTHIGYYADEAEAALAFDRAIRQHNPKDWQKDPAASLNFPERAGEDLYTSPDPGRWGAAVAHWAGADAVLGHSQVGVVTPVGGGARSSSAGGETSTPSHAKITPFHAKRIGASHHPIPSRSLYPGALALLGHGSEYEARYEGAGSFGTASAMASMVGRGQEGAGSGVPKLLHLKELVDAAQEHAGADKAAAVRPVAVVAPQGVKEPSPNLMSNRSTPAMTGSAPAVRVKEEVKPLHTPPLLDTAIELEALRGLVALRARSEPSPVGSSSGYATPPPPSSPSQTLAGDVALFLSASSACPAGKSKKGKSPASYAGTPSTFSTSPTPSTVSGTPWAFMERSCPSPGAIGHRSGSGSADVDSKIVPHAFKRIAKQPAQPTQRQQHKEQHGMRGMCGGVAALGHPTHTSAGPGSVEASGARRAPAKESNVAGSRLPQSFRGVTWDKMKKMWRVRVCLAGGGREHVGYFLDEKEGALAYLRAVERIKQGTYVSSSNKALQPKDLKVSEAGLAAAAAAAAQCSKMGLSLGVSSGFN